MKILISSLLWTAFCLTMNQALAAETEMSDLSALAQQRSWSEILDKGRMVKPAARTADWSGFIQTAATNETQKMASSLAASSKDLENLKKFISSNESNYPFILESQDYTSAKSLALQKVVDICISNSSFGCGGLVESLASGIKSFPKGMPKKVALLLGEEKYPSATLKFWVLAAKDNPAECSHGSLSRAVLAALDREPGSDLAVSGSDLARTCIENLEPQLINKLKSASDNGAYVKNTCKVLQGRQKYTLIKSQKCK